MARRSGGYSRSQVSAARAGQLARTVYRLGRGRASGGYVLLAIAIIIGVIAFFWFQRDTTSHVEAKPGTALEQLEDIEIKGRAPKTGYSRNEFGDGWLDPDGNGCDTRNDVLNRDMVDVTFTDSYGCKIETGVLEDPYTTKVIKFQRGQDSSADVQIDHVVALSDAWQKGAQNLSHEDRQLIANDPLNLLAVDGPANSEKSDADAATWLPPNKEFRCTYVAAQVAVKDKYNLWMTPAEHEAIYDVLAGSCQEQPKYAVAGEL